MQSLSAQEGEGASSRERERERTLVSGASFRFNRLQLQKNSLKILPFGANFRLETTPAEMHKIAAAPPAATGPGGALEAPLAAPKYGTLIPNRIFVGGIR